MSFVDILQMIAALAVTLGLFGVAVWGVRRYGPELTRRLQEVRGQRRMMVLETLILDQKSRLLLVKVDGTERLILVGQGQITDTPAKGVQS